MFLFCKPKLNQIFFPLREDINPIVVPLCGQILHYMIKINVKIKGIIINLVEIRVTQFALDTTLVLDGSQSSLKAALNTLEIFGSYSGLKMKHKQDKVNLDWKKEVFQG